MSLSAKTKRQGDRDPNGQNSGMQLRGNIEMSNELFRIQLGFGLGRNNTITVGEAFANKPFTGFPDRM